MSIRCASFFVESLDRGTMSRSYSDLSVMQRHDRVRAAEQEKRKRQWNMEHEPSMQPMMKCDLAAQLPFFLADLLQVINRLVQVARQKRS
jgi:hypothetical protein